MSDTDEHTLVIIKPHAVKNRHAILKIYQHEGFRPIRWRVLTPERAIVEQHYEEHRNAAHFPTTVSSLCGRLVVYEFCGYDAIRRIREITGKTNPSEAAPGTVRNLHGKGLPFNAVHTSSDPQAAEREITLWFDRERAVDTEPDAELEEE